MTEILPLSIFSKNKSNDMIFIIFVYASLDGKILILANHIRKLHSFLQSMAIINTATFLQPDLNPTPWGGGGALMYKGWGCLLEVLKRTP